MTESQVFLVILTAPFWLTVLILGVGFLIDCWRK